jgi:N-acetylglucosaminyl-diphospho-decaprenol L-rhamnosyltransferase
VHGAAPKSHVEREDGPPARRYIAAVPSGLEVIIVSYNSSTVLASCIDSVEALIADATVAVREHGAGEQQLAAVRAIAAGRAVPIRVEHDPSNPGFGAGCNAMARTSGADHLLFLNPDAVLLTWPWHGGARLPRSTILGPILLGNGRPSAHFGRTYRVRDEIARSWLRRGGLRPRGHGFVSGAALLVERSAFLRAGGFDDRYFLFYEDIEFCLRANAQGISTEVDDRWRVWHCGAHSTGRQFGGAIERSYESACRFHAGRSGNIRVYRAYVVLDAMGRAAFHLARGRPASRAYRRLARRALHDLVRGEPWHEAPASEGRIRT